MLCKFAEITTKTFHREKVRDSQNISLLGYEEETVRTQMPVAASDNLRIRHEDTPTRPMVNSPRGPAQSGHRTTQEPWPNVHCGNLHFSGVPFHRTEGGEERTKKRGHFIFLGTAKKEATVMHARHQEYSI